MNPTTSPQRDWLMALGLLALTWASLAALLDPTFSAMVHIWEHYDTFTHGYVILPMALWLAWRNRHALAATPASPDWRALLLAAPLLCLWLIARLAGADVVEQYALVGLWIAATWALFGLHLVRAAAFPLAFLFLMVPNGTFLIPSLIEFTANFVVAALQLIGIPVYREGAFLSIPTGEWNVIEGCSGMRYLIASFTLGVLYAYLTYRTLWKRMAFGLAAAIIPIVANGFRATMIVLIGHFVGNHYAVGLAHFIYGWVWFGIVTLTMFWVGLAWREDMVPEPARAPPLSPRSPALMAAACVGLAALFPVWEGVLDARPLARTASALSTPVAMGGWRSQARPFAVWLPHWVGMDGLLTANYARGKESVLLYAAYYARQRSGEKLVSGQNRMVPEEHDVWQNVGSSRRIVSVSGHPLEVVETRLRLSGEGQRILAWQWNRVQGGDTVNPYLIKIRLTLTRLLGGRDDGTALIIAAPYQDHQDEAEKSLIAFLTDMEPGLQRLADQR